MEKSRFKLDLLAQAMFRNVLANLMNKGLLQHEGLPMGETHHYK